MLFAFNIGNGGLQSAGKIDVEQRSVETVNNCQLPSRSVRLRFVEVLLQRGATFRGCAVSTLCLDVMGASLARNARGSVALFSISGGCCTIGASNASNAEDGLPRHGANLWERSWGGVPETSRHQRSLRPSVVDAGEVEVDRIWRCVSIELIAHVDKVLDGSDVDIVDGREVKDDSLERGTSVILVQRLAATWSGIIPRTILREVSVQRR